jgi:hypothetical protein
MPVCDECKREMLDPATATCTVTTVEFPDGGVDPAVAYEIDWTSPNEYCHDCGVADGGFHHPGCDAERCPRCGGQLISCGCLDDEEELEAKSPTNSLKQRSIFSSRSIL